MKYYRLNAKHSIRFLKCISILDDELVEDENVNSLDPSLVVLTVTETRDGSRQSVSTVSRKGSGASESDPRSLRVPGNDLK